MLIVILYDIIVNLEQLFFFQGDNDTMLQEELHKMQVALAEERKVTEKLSRNLELEKRRVESMEQKVKNTFRKSDQASSGSNQQHLPDEIRQRDDQLTDSMAKFRMQCENLAAGLEDCEGKLASFEIQVKCFSEEKKSLPLTYNKTNIIN